MKGLLLFLFICLIFNELAWGMPSESDRQTALNLMYTISNQQEQTFYENSNYETVPQHYVDGLMPSVEAYSTLQGKGYIITVAKVENGKVWIIQRHEGPDANVDLNIKDSWTITN